MLDIAMQLEQIMPTALEGSVVRTLGMTAAVADLPAPVGATVQIERETGEPVQAEVIGFRDELTIVYPLSHVGGIRRGNRVRLVRTVRSLRAGHSLLGRVVNAHGVCMDGRPHPVLADRVLLERDPLSPIERPPISTPLATGIRAVDGLLTCGRGQRTGIFSGSGVGKSVLLGMMARNTAADVTVIGLIGERGREVNEFIQRDLGPEGLERSVVVVATSDEPSVMRVRAAWTATALAEYFRDQGSDVLLLMDSLTRFATAQREIGLAAGEPPTTRGFPPSVFSLLSRLVERAGRTTNGSITAFYSVLVEADDPNEPISDAVRGLLDGHTWLSRKLAARGQFPAIDILDSISRVMSEVTGAEHLEAARTVRELLSVYRDHEDLISVGAYQRGSNPLVDRAIDQREQIEGYLRQGMNETSTFKESNDRLMQLMQKTAAPPVTVPATPAADQSAST